jgi:hypothetical protein
VARLFIWFTKTARRCGASESWLAAIVLKKTRTRFFLKMFISPKLVSYYFKETRDIKRKVFWHPRHYIDESTWLAMIHKMCTPVYSNKIWY